MTRTLSLLIDGSLTEAHLALGLEHTHIIHIKTKERCTNLKSISFSKH